MIKSKKTYLIISLMLVVVLAVLIAMSTQALAASLSKVSGFNKKFEGQKAKLEWGAVEGADGYEVYVSIPGREEKYLGSTSTPKASIVGFSRGSKYGIRVRAFRVVDGKKEMSEYSDNVELQLAEDTVNKLDNVQNFNVKISDKKARITWDKVIGANGYEVHVDVPEMGYIYLGAVSGTSGTISGFTENMDYKVKIRAFMIVNGKKEYSEYSEELGIKIDESMSIPDPTLNKVTNVQVVVKDQVATVTWSPVTGADKYEILLTKPNGSMITIESDEITKKITDITDTSGEYKIQVQSYRTVEGIRLYGQASDEVKFKSDKKDGTSDSNNPNIPNNPNKPENPNDPNNPSNPNNPDDTNKPNESDKTEQIAKPENVTGLKITSVNTTTATASWNVVKKTDKYNIGYKIEIIDQSNHKTTRISQTATLDLNNLQAGKTYIVRVLSYKIVPGKDNVEAQNWTEIVFKTAPNPPSAPTGIKITEIGINSAKLVWNKVTRNDEYSVGYEIRVFDKNGNLKSVYASGDNSFNLIELEQGKKYSIQIGAYSHFKVESENRINITEIVYSGKVEFLTNPITPTAPTDLRVSGIGENYASISWTESPNVDDYTTNYQIEAYDAKGNLVLLGKPDSNNYHSLRGLQPDTEYKVRVGVFKNFVVNETLISNTGVINADYITLKTTKSASQKPAKVTGMALEKVSDANVTLKWNKVTVTDGAAISYEVKITDMSTNTSDTKTTTSTSIKPYIHSNKMYTVQVRACRNDGTKGDYSDIMLLNKPTIVSGSMNGEKPQLGWNALSGVEGYEALIDFGGTKTLKYTVTGKTTLSGRNDNKYTGSYYAGKVRAYKTINNKKVYGFYSDDMLLCGPVKNVVPTMSGKNATIKWDAMTGVNGYEVDQWISEVGNYQRDVGTARTYTTNDCEGNGARVRAYKNINGVKVYGQYSDYVFLVKVANVTAKLTNGTAKVTWNKVANATGYEVTFKRTEYKDWTSLPLTTTNSKIITGVQVGDQICVKAYRTIDGTNKAYGQWSTIYTVK